MAIDISELIEAAERFPIREDTIKIEDGELSFLYNYLSHLMNPFDHYYDRESQELHIMIKQDAFPFGSGILQEKIKLPKDTKKIRVDYIGKSIVHLSPEQKLEHFFPKLKPGENNDKSGYDGCLEPE